MVLGTTILARLLTPADFGILATTSTILLLSLYALEGLVEYPLLREGELDEDTVSSLLWLSIIVSSAAGTLLYLIAPALERFFEFKGTAAVYRFIAPCVVVQAIAVAGRGLMRRQHRFRDVSGVFVASSIVYLVVAVVLAAAGYSYWSLVGAQVASFSAMAILFAKNAELSLAFPNRFVIKGVVSTASYGSLSRVLAWLWTQIDTIAVSVTSSAMVTGLYSRSYNLSTQAKEPLAAIDHPIRQALIAHRERGGAIEDIAIMLLRLQVLISGIFAAFLVIFREPIIYVFLGDQWRDAAIPFAILVAGLPARVARLFMDSVALAGGQMKHMVIRHATLCLVVGSVLAVVAQKGFLAVAVAVTVSMYVALAVPTRRPSSDNLSKFMRYFFAMVPGISSSAIVVSVCEVLRAGWTGPSYHFYATVFCFFVLLVLVAAFAMPSSWLIPQMLIVRKKWLDRMLVWRI